MQQVRECIETESGCERSRFLLPIEFDYLSREARSNILPNTSEFTNEFLFSLTADENEMFTKHFKLFKSPKAVCKLDEMKTKGIRYYFYGHRKVVNKIYRLIKNFIEFKFFI